MDMLSLGCLFSALGAVGVLHCICGGFLEDCEAFFNLAGGIFLETTYLIQDDSSPSLFRDQEIYLLSVLE